MEWTDEEVGNAEDARADAEEKAHHADPNADKWRAGVAAIMTHAVELKAARGGTMTAERWRGILNDVAQHLGGTTMHAIDAHASSLGARVAVLEAEVQKAGPLALEVMRLRAELDALKPSGQVAEDEALIMRELHEGGSDYDQHLAALHRLAAQAERAEAAQRDAAHWQARVDAAHEELADVAPKDGDLCTKIRALVAECDDLRLRLTGLEVAGAHLSAYADKTAGAPLGSYELARNFFGGACALLPNVERADTAAPDDAQRREERMREMCRQIVAEEFITDGLDRSALHKRIMERMEGAVP